MRQKLFGLLLLSITISLLFFQNCSSKGFNAFTSSESFSSTGSGNDGNGNKDGGGGEEQTLTPTVGRAQGKLSEDCENESNYNACIFYKNPVVTKGSSVSGGVELDTKLDRLGIQKFAVVIDGMDDSGYLQNSKFVIDPTLTLSSGDSNPSGLSRVRVNSEGKWFYPYEGASGAGDSGKKVSQLMAYYWLNEFDRILKSQTGAELTQGVTYYVDTYNHADSSRARNNAFFSPGTDDDGSDAGIVVLGWADGAQVSGASYRHDMAMSAEVYAHEVCHGFFEYSANGAHRPPSGASDPNSNSSGSSCRNQNGCIRALNEGQADFCINILFPDKLALGETWVNNSSGLNSRSMEANDNKSASSLFASTGGAIHNYGALYASMWHHVWKQAKQTGNEKDIETIYSKHLARLTYRDHFVTALAVIKNIASTNYSGKGYENLFQSEWDRRGL
ncbi:MAG: hypothetical protein KDD61_12610 [Bdellovibrionales bacterium]|nr:hypothetical protein [Bdellovibrionales bacterium]